jgi:gamma-glutamyltranspeptidase/glutathione hydrolase
MTVSRAGVTASSAEAAAAGAAILQRGGNAVDAAIATAFASSVADPGNTGIGGYGGHMVVARPGQAPFCVDFNMWLPARMSPTAARRSYVNCHPAVTAVPNVVAGLALALDRFGSRPWAELIEPAIDLAALGVEANGTTRRSFREIAGTDFEKATFVREPDGGDSFRFRQPALARTLAELARQGPQWFYEGPLGSAACAILEAAGSPITPRDWADAPRAAKVVPASAVDLAGASAFSSPLATSGAPALFATVAKGAALARSHDLDSPAAILAWTRALAALWSYRFGTPQGNDFSVVTVTDWIGQALRHEPAAALTPSAGHTCHLNACDEDGTLVALTFTHGQFHFGGRWAVPDSGVIMNAGMHLLTAADPVVADGRSYAVTNMSPTIARGDDGAWVAMGCPGARRIPTRVGLALARHLFGRLSVQDAVSRGRFHAETGGLASVEATRCSAAAVEALRSGFAIVEDEPPGGALTAIRREPEGALSFGLDDRDSKGFSSTA